MTMKTPLWILELKEFSTWGGSSFEIGFVIVRGFLSIYLKEGTNEDKIRLLSSRESIHPLSVYGELSLEHRLRFVLNGKMEHLTTHLHKPRTTRSPLSFWGDGGIVPFEPFFHAFPGGLEKAAINRTFLILPSFQEEREIIFP
ncbi:hypothetical protein ZWY2020_051990 [Hordeum vulgare]|nr:hypothetical protein ZWY2020_051990 [Hordeum vulgare]